jgi:pimeloyl-ACP methyl ester carboxylesterase
MGTAGLALMALAPGDETLTALGWVWPPLLLALTLWMTHHARTTLHSRTRAWLLYPIFAALAATSIGGALETVHGDGIRNAGPMPGKLYSVNGHNMHLRCEGAGSPTVLLEGGMGEDSASWAWVMADVARATKVCAYDRPGQGWSDESPTSPNAGGIASDLHKLLAEANVAGPYVLAGHSTGGTYAMVFAKKYPTEVAGMVLLDSASPRQMTALPDYASFYSGFRRASALFPTLARVGIGHLAYHDVGSDLPSADSRAEHAFATSARSQRNQRDEFAALPDSFRQAQTLTTLTSTPLVVITASEKQQNGWSAEQDRMTTLSSNSVHRVVPASHDSLLCSATDSRFSSQGIRAAVTAVRANAAVHLP